MTTLDKLRAARRRVREFAAREYHDAEDVAELCAWQIDVLHTAEHVLLWAADLCEFSEAQHEQIDRLLKAIRSYSVN